MLRNVIGLVVFLVLVTMTGGAQNSDFEAVPPGPITSSTQIPGWTISSFNYSNSPSLCNINPCCYSQPISAEVIDAPNGYIDPNIGNAYTLFSIFGNTPGKPVAHTLNPELTSMRGNRFIMLNGYQTYPIGHKLTRQIVVTSTRKTFNLAFVFVSEASYHQCCYNPMIKLVANNKRTGLPLPCPALEIYPSSPVCINTVSAMQFLSTNGFRHYNKWKNVSLDLSGFVGDTIQLDVLVTNCITGGHIGYVYIDAEEPQTDYLTYNGGQVFLNADTVSVGACARRSNLIAPLGYSVTWTMPGGGTVNTPSLQPPTNGLYQLHLKPNSLCPVPEKKYYVNHYLASFSVGIAVTNSALCYGEQVTLTASGAKTYTWSNGLTGAVNVITLNSYTTISVVGEDAPVCKDVDSIRLEHRQCLALNENSDWPTSKILIAPNPTEKTCTITMHQELVNAQLVIFDATLRELKRLNVTGQEFKLNTSDLKAGNYLVGLFREGAMVALQKLIITNLSD